MDPNQKPYWFPDMPGVIALIMVAAVVILAFMLAVRDPGGDMFKFMVGGLMTVGFASIMAFYYGSSSGSKDKDNAIIGQMAPAKNPPNPPPIITVKPWWEIMTDPERKSITDAAVNDPKVNVAMTTMMTGHASADDLDYLVSKGLLTREAADAIKIS